MNLKPNISKTKNNTSPHKYDNERGRRRSIENVRRKRNKRHDRRERKNVDKKFHKTYNVSENDNGKKIFQYFKRKIYTQSFANTLRNFTHISHFRIRTVFE